MEASASRAGLCGRPLSSPPPRECARAASRLVLPRAARVRWAQEPLRARAGLQWQGDAGLPPPAVPLGPHLIEGLHPQQPKQEAQFEQQPPRPPPAQAAAAAGHAALAPSSDFVRLCREQLVACAQALGTECRLSVYLRSPASLVAGHVELEHILTHEGLQHAQGRTELPGPPYMRNVGQGEGRKGSLLLPLVKEELGEESFGPGQARASPPPHASCLPGSVLSPGSSEAPPGDGDGPGAGAGESSGGALLVGLLLVDRGCTCPGGLAATPESIPARLVLRHTADPAALLSHACPLPPPESANATGPRPASSPASPEGMGSGNALHSTNPDSAPGVGRQGKASGGAGKEPPRRLRVQRPVRGAAVTAPERPGEVLMAQSPLPRPQRPAGLSQQPLRGMRPLRCDAQVTSDPDEGGARAPVAEKGMERAPVADDRGARAPAGGSAREQLAQLPVWAGPSTASSTAARGGCEVEVEFRAKDGSGGSVQGQAVCCVDREGYGQLGPGSQSSGGPGSQSSGGPGSQSSGGPGSQSSGGPGSQRSGQQDGSAGMLRVGSDAGEGLQILSGIAWLSAEEEEEVRKTARTLTLACVLEQRTMFIQHSVRQHSRHLEGLMVQTREPLAVIRTLGALLAPQVSRSELGPDMVQGVMEAGAQLSEMLEDATRSVLCPPILLNGSQSAKSEEGCR